MQDKIKELIEKIDIFSNNQQYEEAQKALNMIKEELSRPANLEEKYNEEWVKSFSKGEKRVITIKDTQDILTGGSIRIDPEYYPFSDWLYLLIQINEKIANIDNIYLVTDRLRRIVAEEMVAKKMIIPPAYRGKRPNRAFLDQVLNVKGGIDICSKEMDRRLKSLLWQAIEKGDKIEIEEARKNIAKFHKSKYVREDS